MIVKKSIQNHVATLRVEGRIDTSTAFAFREELSNLDYDSLLALRLDFGGVEYITSAGLRELLIAQKRFGDDKHFDIVNVAPMVAEIFMMTGFQDILEFTLAGENRDYSHISFKDFLARK